MYYIGLDGVADDIACSDEHRYSLCAYLECAAYRQLRSDAAQLVWLELRRRPWRGPGTWKPSRRGRINFSCSDQYLIPHYPRNQGGKHVSNTRQFNPHPCYFGYKSEVHAF